MFTHHLPVLLRFLSTPVLPCLRSSLLYAHVRVHGCVCMYVCVRACVCMCSDWLVTKLHVAPHTQTQTQTSSGQTASPDIQHIRSIHTVLAKRHHQIFSIYGVYIRLWPNDTTRYSAYTEYTYGSGQTASPDVQHIRCIYTVLAKRYHQIFSIHRV